MTVRVVVTPEQAAAAVPAGSVVAVTGTSTYDGSTVTFAGDWRPVSEFLDAVIADGHAHHCEVEPWQILSRA